MTRYAYVNERCLQTSCPWCGYLAFDADRTKGMFGYEADVGLYNVCWCCAGVAEWKPSGDLVRMTELEAIGFMIRGEWKQLQKTRHMVRSSRFFVKDYKTIEAEEKQTCPQIWHH